MDNSDLYVLIDPRVRVDCHSGPALQKPLRLTLYPERSIPLGEGSVNPSENSWQALCCSHEPETNGCGQAQVQGRAPGEWEHVPLGGLGRGGLGCSLEVQEGNKDGEQKAL